MIRRDIKINNTLPSINQCANGTINWKESKVELLQSLLKSQETALLAVYGRRRIGKTFLIRKTMEKAITFEFVGANNISLKEQLGNFTEALIESGATMLITPPKSWSDAFYLLFRHLEGHHGPNKQVVFLNCIETGHLSFGFGTLIKRSKNSKH